MRALIATRPGEEHPFDIAEVPVPAPGPGQLRIKVAASTIQNVDLGVMNGFMHQAGYLEPAAQSGLGNDIAGIVDALGPGTAGFVVGDRVAGYVPPWVNEPRELGAHADYVVVPAEVVAHVPDDLELVAAATIPMNGVTAMQGLAMAPMDAGNNLLITGAAGEVGGFATTLAVRSGWQVTALARSFDDEQFLRRAGAESIVDSPAGLSGFDSVLDAAKLGEGIFSAIRDGGALVEMTGERKPIASVRNISVFSLEAHPDGSEVTQLLELAAAGILQTRVAGTLPLADAAQGFAKMRDRRGLRGRWVLVP